MWNKLYIGTVDEMVVIESHSNIISDMDINTSSTKMDLIPWYRTRWFWGIVIGTLIAWGLFLYFSAFHRSENTIDRILVDLSFSMGGTFFTLVGSNFGKLGQLLGALTYFVIIGLLLYKTFDARRIGLLYPIIFVIVFLLGSLFTTLYLSGL